MKIYSFIAFYTFVRTVLSAAITQSSLNEPRAVRGCRLEKKVNVEDLQMGARQLYQTSLASLNEYSNPTRVIGSSGHAGTASYIMESLEQLSDFYDFYAQYFNASYSSISNFSISVEQLQLTSVSAFNFSPKINKTSGKVVVLKNLGCNAEDYPDNLNDSVVLIKRGICTFSEKSKLAKSLGAIGVIIYNNEDTAIQGTLGEPSENLEYATTFGLSLSDAEKLIKLANESTGELNITISMDSFIHKVLTSNIIAETKSGDHDNLVMVGAHSDSVTTGPGINDNGSGTITLLNLANYLTNFKINNAVRFAWWSAEEEGLIGSDYYTANLSPEENLKIRLFLDYDMLASPNYVFQVYDSNDSVNPPGSSHIRDEYIKYYKRHNRDYVLIPFDGRSDYVGFIKNSIPAGGIATGAEGHKTKKESVVFGGESGVAYDQCYHQLCDDLNNLNYEAWLFNSKLIAFTLGNYAKSLQGFPLRELTVGVSGYEESLTYHGDKLII